MALLRMAIREVVYDDVTDTISFVLDGQAAPPPAPPGVNPMNFYASPLTIRTTPLPVRKGTLTQPTAGYITADPTTGQPRYYRVTWDAAAGGWGAAVETTADGNALR